MNTQWFVLYKKPTSQTKTNIARRLKIWQKIYQAKGPWKQAGVDILISDKVDFKPQLVKRDKEGHVKSLKGAIYQQEITIVNLYVPNVSTSNHYTYTNECKNTDKPQHRDSWKLQYSSITDRSFRQKISKKV
jgi:hypothetical protein